MSHSTVIERFFQLSAIPRGTRHEAQIRQWLIDWAEQKRFTWQTDAAGNLVVRVPGRADASPVILQSHLDMVWQKTPDSTHDFLTDPILPIQQGDTLRAKDTTLGADNGIGVALMMAIAENTAISAEDSAISAKEQKESTGKISRPPLELLFTVEEEQGVGGAERLDPVLLTGKVLINLDSEEEGKLTVGCAGGATTKMRLPFHWEAPESTDIAFVLKVAGLLGGHSGEDIHLPRANAIKLAGRVLNLVQRNLPIRLAGFSGGSASNAIPRDAEVRFVCAAEAAARCRGLVQGLTLALQEEYRLADAGLTLTLEPTDLPQQVSSVGDAQRAVRLLAALPNGVSAYMAGAPDSVETSNNIGVIAIDAGGLMVISNQRSAVYSRLEEITFRIQALAQLAGAEIEQSGFFHPWTPNLESDLLARCQRVYRAVFHEDAQVRVSHGGLECGLISERCGGLDTLSLGPTIHYPHSPNEELYLPSVERVRQFLVALVEEG